MTTLNFLESAIARSSAEEIVLALGLGRAPRAVRAAARSVFAGLSRRLGRVLARFDGDIVRFGLPRAAATALDGLEAKWACTGAVPPSGSLLVLANHPGAYDSLVLFAAMDRRDVAVLVDERSFFRSLPALNPHLVPLANDPWARMRSVRRAMRHLASGGALLHFGAGRIEPDPAFDGDGDVLAPWKLGSGFLARSAARTAGAIVPALVQGVHSARVKGLWISRVAERHGLTMLAPLLQMAVPAYRQVAAAVHFGDAREARLLVGESGDVAVLTARVRGSVLALQRPRG